MELAVVRHWITLRLMAVDGGGSYLEMRAEHAQDPSLADGESQEQDEIHGPRPPQLVVAEQDDGQHQRANHRNGHHFWVSPREPGRVGFEQKQGDESRRYGQLDHQNGVNLPAIPTRFHQEPVASHTRAAISERECELQTHCCNPNQMLSRTCGRMCGCRWNRMARSIGFRSVLPSLSEKANCKRIARAYYPVVSRLFHGGIEACV